MGKQFAIRLNQNDMNNLCFYLHQNGFHIYDRNQTKYLTKHCTDVLEERFLSNDLAQNLESYDSTFPLFTTSAYPIIEFCCTRFWIDSREKGQKIWNDFDEIKKWVRKNFKKAKDGVYCSVDRIGETDDLSKLIANADEVNYK